MSRMFKIAFSTTACPDWTLDQVAEATLKSSFEGVEFRTFGAGGSTLACDPALTAPAKTIDIFDDDGVDFAGLAASSRFDAPISPPVVGWIIGDFEKEVREAKRHIDLAESLGASYVRVFAFEPSPGERASAAQSRIVKRLSMLCDHARNRGVTIALENGGGYQTASAILDIIDDVDSPLLGASYALATGHAAGDDPQRAVAALGERLIVARMKDLKKGRPCLLGHGDIPCERFARAVADASGAGWLVYEWDRVWDSSLAAPGDVLPQAAELLSNWLYGATSGAERLEHATA